MTVIDYETHYREGKEIEAREEGVLTDDEVQIQLIDNLSPLVITAGNFLGLTMPYRQ